MSEGYDSDVVVFRTDRVSSRQMWGQAWAILWPEHFWITVGICLIGLIVGSAAPMAVLMGPMMCGMYMCFFAMMRNERPTFDLLFRGFDVFIESLVATLVVMGISFVVVFGLIAVLICGGIAVVATADRAGGGVGPALAVVGLIVFYPVMIIVMIVVQALFIFAYPLIVDYNLSGLDAVKLSVRAVWANLGNVIRLTILNSVASMSVVFFCFPILVVVPISMLAQALLYRRIFPGPTFATAYGDPQSDPESGGGGYQLDGGISETGPGAGTQIDEWE